MVLDLSRYTPDSFVRAVDHAIADPAFVLTVPAQSLLALAPQDQITHFFKCRHQGVTTYGQHLVNVGLSIASPTAALAKMGVEFHRERAKLKQARRPEALFGFITIERAFVALADRDKAMLAGAARLVAAHAYTPDEWHRFIHTFAWGNGTGTLMPDKAIAADKDTPFAVQTLQELLKHLYAHAGDLLVRTARDIAAHATRSPGTSLDASLFSGARWTKADDIEASSHYAITRSAPSLFLGKLDPSGEYIYYNGHESGVVIAGPGAGKSSALVIPNLLTYPGSVIVLDVKGELWDKTAAYRRDTFGPVYRFAPTDPTRNTHRFNPFDFISSDPEIASHDCEVFGQQVILERADDKDPYWEGKGRDFFWAFAYMLAIGAVAGERTMAGVSQLLSMSTALEDPDDRSTANPDTLAFIEAMHRTADRYDVADLRHAATALYDGLGSNRIESVFDAARRHLGTFNRSLVVRDAMATSDWSPQDLRTTPGTSLYICINDPKAYGAVVRLLLFQHYRLLRSHVAKSGEAPITFFLDEMPRLGNFTSILEMQDIGRSAGLRLWMFAQSYGQLVQNFGAARAPGLVDGCRVRCFIEPQRDEVNFILPALGERRNIFTGEREPLATVDQLQGHGYSGKIIVTTRGARPMTLKPLYAHATPALASRMRVPPPVR